MIDPINTNVGSISNRVDSMPNDVDSPSEPGSHAPDITLDIEGISVPQNQVTQVEVLSLAKEISAFVANYNTQIARLEREREAETSRLERERAAGASRIDTDIKSELSLWEKNRDQKLANARRTLAAANEAADANLSSFRANASAVLGQISNRGRSAAAHLGKNEIPIPPEKPLFASLSSISKGDLFTAMDAANASVIALKKLESINSYRTISDTVSILTCLVGVAFAVLGGILNYAYTSAAIESAFVFIFILIASVISGVALRYFINGLQNTRFQNLYSEIVQCWQVANSTFSNLELKARSDCYQAKLIATNTFNENQKNNITQYLAKKPEIERKYQLLLSQHEEKYQREALEQKERHLHVLSEFIDFTLPDAYRLKQKCKEYQESTYFAGLPWSHDGWSKWTPTSLDGGVTPASVAFGSIMLNDTVVIGSTEFTFALPALISLDSGRGLMFKVPAEQKAQAVIAVQSVMLRLLACMPPGMVRFTMFDPIGLGQNVAAFMPLAKHDDKLVTSRAWSEPRHIEKELEQLSMHLQNVIQMRLRNDHKNIEEYNQKSKVKEPYRIVVAIDFPINFSEDSIRRLTSIAENGARCGVYPLIVVDTDSLSKSAPYKFDLENLARHMEVISPNFLAPRVIKSRSELDLPVSGTAGEQMAAVAKVGETYTGTVSRIVEFGAFVEILPGIEGLLHISEISHRRIRDVRDELKEGQQILVKCIWKEGDKVKLSRKVILDKENVKRAPEAFEITLVKSVRNDQIYDGYISDLKILAERSVYLVLNSANLSPEFARRLTDSIKISSAYEIDVSVEANIRGFQLIQTERPRSIPLLKDSIYLRLSIPKSGWDGIRESKTLSVYMPHDAANIRPQLFVLDQLDPTNLINPHIVG